MIWKRKYKRRSRYQKILNKIQFLNFKANVNNSYRILLWIVFILIFYSIIQYNFFNSYENKDYRNWNKNQIKELNLSELYQLKDLNHHNVRVWVMNHTNQRGLAAKISDCLLKGYYIGNVHTKGDYNILKQDNFNGDWNDSKKTEIFVHVDTINNPKFMLHVKELLLFTGYNDNIIKYRYEKKLHKQRDITIKLGEDWNETGNLIQCSNPIN